MKKRTGALLSLFAVTTFAACGGGGSSIAPAGTTSAPMATPSPVSTSVTNASPTAAPTPTPTISAIVATSAPTATPTATPAKSTQCTDPQSGVASENWTLSGSALTITIPPYGTFAGTLAVPANSPTGTVIDEGADQSNFNGAPLSTSGDPAYAARTKDFFMTFRLSQATAFGTAGTTALIPLMLTSTCLTSGATYYLDVFDNGTFQYVGSAVVSGGSVTENLGITQNPFPANDYMNAVLSH